MRVTQTFIAFVLRLDRFVVREDGIKKIFVMNMIIMIIIKNYNLIVSCWILE